MSIPIVMPSKFGNKKTVVDNITFDSKAEASYYEKVLKPLLAAGKITDLKVHTRFPIVINGHKVCTYVCDFQYNENGKRVVCDVKGVITQTYVIKRALMKVVLGIDITEVRV